MTPDLFSAMKNRVVNYSFYPGTAQFLGDPRLGPEDAIAAMNYAGDKFLLPCMNLIHDYDGGLTTTITTPGQAVSEQTQGPLTQQVERLSTEMVLVKEVIAKKITADEADIRYATIQRANILEANITTLQGDLADYKTVVAGELAAAKGWMLEGAIGSAQISDLDVAKLNAGILDTAIINLSGTDGKLQIIDNTIQISDDDRVRVQIGKDDSGDYTLAVWDSSGRLIWDALGATEDTIQRKIIRDQMVADDANIQGYKLDINSVVTSINGATTKIDGTVVQVGNKALNIALSEQEAAITEQGETISKQAAEIKANEDSIKLKVDSQTYAEDKKAIESSLSKAASDISILQNQIALKVEQTDINKSLEGYSTTLQMEGAITSAKDEINLSVSSVYAKQDDLGSVETRLSAAEQKLTKDGIIQTVGDYYALDSDLTDVENRIATAESTIVQHSSEIALTVKEADVTGDYLIGKINLSSTTASIKARNIELEGLVTANGNFKILEDGSVETVNGKFNGEINCGDRFKVAANGDTYANSIWFAAPDQAILSGYIIGYEDQLQIHAGDKLALDAPAVSVGGAITCAGTLAMTSYSAGMTCSTTFGSAGIVTLSNGSGLYLYTAKTGSSSWASSVLLADTNGINLVPKTGGTFTGAVTCSSTLTVNSQITTNTIQVGSSTVNGGVELYHATPFIDFHFGRSTNDYTSRIIENSSGMLTCSGHWLIGSTNAKYLYMRNTSGTVRQMVGLNSSNNYQYAYDSYANSEGITYLNGNEVRLRSRGNIYVSKAVTVGSDKRLKHDIENLNLAPELIRAYMDIDAKTFVFNKGDGRIETGIIAQDAIEAMEKNGLDWTRYGLVSTFRDEDEDDMDYYSVGYGFLNTITMCLTQKHEGEIEYLKGKCLELTMENVLLKAQLESLRQQISHFAA